MNKKLFLVLFLALILVVGLVYAKNINQTVEKKASTTVLSKEAAKAVKTAPQVTEEQAIPQEEVVKVARPAFPGLEGLEPEERAMLQSEAVLEPEIEAALQPLDFCLIRNDSVAYRYTVPTWNGARKFATFLDPEYVVVGVGTACPQPIYPFEVDSVICRIYFAAKGGYGKANAFLMYADFSDPYCPYPGDTIPGSVGPTIDYVEPAGADYYIGMPIPPTCVYDRFFAGVSMQDTVRRVCVTHADTSFKADSTCDFLGTGAICDSVGPQWWYARWKYFDTRKDSTCDTAGTGAKCDSAFTWNYKRWEYFRTPVTPAESTCTLTGTRAKCDSTFIMKYKYLQYDTTYQLMYWEYFNKCVPPVIAGKESCIVAINVLAWGRWDPVSQMCLYPWMPPFDSCAFEAETLWGHWELDSTCTSPTPTAQYPLRPPCEVITIVDTTCTFTGTGALCDSAKVWTFKRWEYVTKPDSACTFTGTGAKCDSAKVWTFKRWKYVTKPDSACTWYISTGAKCDSVYGYRYKRYLRDSSMVIDTITMGTCPVLYSPRMDYYGQACKGYMGLERYGWAWYDMVADYATYGFQVIRVAGHNASQNDCPPDTLWYEKPAAFDPPNKYAPCGVPDFSQYDHGYPNNGMAYCGPTAVANCLWWCANFWPVTSIRNYWGGWTPAGPPILIQDIASYFHTDPIAGTDINALKAGLDTLILAKSFFISGVTKAKPNWWYLEYQLRQSQDVILLLGFYQEDPPGTWTRIGGHYVTMAGVNKGQKLIELSDPAADMAETPGAGWVCSNGIYIPHAPIPHPAVFTIHDDAGNTSYDVYRADTSFSPGGVVALPDYPKTVAEKFVGKNGVAGTYKPALPVMTEIEYAVVICPISALLTGQINSWDLTVVKSNFGEEGCEDSYGWVWWASPYGYRNDLWIGSVIVGTNPNDLAVALKEVGSVDYQPMGRYNLEDPIQWTNPMGVPYVVTDGDTLEGDTSWTEYYSLNNTDLKVHMRAFGFYDYDYDYPAINDAVIQEFTITNRGTSPIADVEWALFLDLDPDYARIPETTSPRVLGDSVLNTLGIYEVTTPKQIDYMTLVPTNGQIVPTGIGGEQNTWLFPESRTGGPYVMLDSVMNINRWDVMVGPPPVFDYALMLVSEKFTLASSSVQTYFLWSDSVKITDPGSNLAKKKLFHLLKWLGFYRGDANCNGFANLADATYLANFILKSGPAPKPFKDQGDANGNGIANLADATYMGNYVLKSGPAPIDYPRWPLQNFPPQQSLFKNPNWGNIGQ